MYNQAVIIAAEESKDKRDKKESTAVALRLKPESKFFAILACHSLVLDGFDKLNQAVHCTSGILSIIATTLEI